jgi:hypothetical protein
MESQDNFDSVMGITSPDSADNFDTMVNRQPQSLSAGVQEVPTVSQPVAAQPESKRGMIADIGVGVVHGAEAAVRGVRETARGIERMLPESFQDANVNEPLTYGTPSPESGLGKLTADVVRFATGFIGAGAVVKGAGLVAGAAKSAISTTLTTDPNAERLSNLIEEHPYLANPVTEFLSSKPGDTFAEGKFKSAIEDLGLSAVGGALISSLKLAKAALVPQAAESVANPLKATLPKVAEAAKAGETAATDTTGFTATATKMAEDVGLKLTPEHTQKLATALDELVSKPDLSLEALHSDRSILNVSKMNTGEDVKATINKFGEILGPIMKASGWKESQTHLETINLAEELGLEPDNLRGALSLMGRDANTIPQTIVAGRMLLQSSASALFTAARKASITGLQQDKAEALAHLDHVGQTLADLKMITTGAARATESGRIPVGEIDPDRLAAWIKTQGGADNVLRKISMTEGNPTAIAKLARSIDENVQDKLDAAFKIHNTIWINGLLSSPKTQIVNTVSTGLNVLLQPLNLMAGGTLRRDWNDVREGVAIYKGLGTFLNDSFTLAKKSFMTESQVLGGNKIVEPSVAMIDSNATWAQALRFPTRLLGASDEFFKQLSYRSKMSAQAAREGLDAVKSGKITQAELESFISDRFAAAFNKDGAALNQDALKYAEQATFTQSLDRPTWLGNWAQGISSMSSHPALRGTVLPFVRVPSNLLRQVIDYTPVVGQLRKKFLVDMQEGGSVASEALGRMTVGSGLWVGAGMLALDGKITGAASRDPELAAQQKRTGWQPYSYVISNGDGTKSYISFNRLDPFASFLGLAADFAQIYGHLPEKKQDEWASIATLSIANNLMSKSYLKGVIDSVQALAGTDPNKMATWIRQRVASYIPAVVGVAQPDTELKELRTWMDGAIAKTPGLSGTIEARRDPVTGEKMQATSGWSQSWNPFTLSHGNNDPVNAELSRLAQTDAQSQFSGPSEHLGNIDLTQFKKASGQTAYDRLCELTGKGVYGPSLHDALLSKIQSPSYQNGSDGDSFYTNSSRINMLRMVQNEYKDRALRQVQQEYPGLRDAMVADKQNVSAVRHGKQPRTTIDKLRAFGQQ